MSSRSAPTMGAVRLTAHHKPQRLRHLRKLSLGLLAVTGGILVTTQSNGTTDASKPALAVVSTLSSPTFFFNDRDDALDQQQQALSSSAAETMVLPTVNESVVNESVVNETVVEPAAAREIVVESATAPEPVIESVIAPETVLAMHIPTGLSGAEFESDYATQQADTQASQPVEPVYKPFVAHIPAPKSTPFSPLVNHPSIAAIRKKAEFPDGATTESVVVAAGDTLSKLLNDRGVKIDQMPQLLTDNVVKQYLSNLDIGQTFQIVRLANGDFHSLSARVGNDRKISIRRSSSGFATASIDLPVEKERVVTSGTIEQSLFVAADQADLKQSTIMELSDIFQWELDFARDIRKGDQFSLIYDRLYREGKYIGDGDILAAEFVRGGKRYQAIRYTDPKGNTGYYSPDGQSKRRTFLRHPVDVVRITSKFDPKRVHPVLHKIRAHKGVDYGAPTGTPIRATADGTVRFAGRKSAFGNTVILNHGTDIRTLYAHMSRISDKVANGKRVKQGDVIGYVGATGRVTGAHLHYEFQKNGNHVDPLKVELPAAQPLKAELRDDLRDLSDDLLAQMQSVLPDTNEPMVKAAPVTTVAR